MMSEHVSDGLIYAGSVTRWHGAQVTATSFCMACAARNRTCGRASIEVTLSGASRDEARALLHHVRPQSLVPAAPPATRG